MLWSAASTGMALSLGRSQGAAFLGRPLDISIRAVLDDSESPSEACVRADVFYADTRVDSSRVRVSIEKTGTDQEVLIRVRTSAVVDEPVVTVYVRATCARNVERRYVLLADPVPEQASAAALSQSALPRERLAANPPAIATPTAINGAVKKPAVSRPRPQPVQSQSADTAALAAPRAMPQRAVKPAARLKLEPLDLTLEVSPQLKSSSEMVSLPATSAEQRALAAATWKALTTDAADVLADTGKMNLMEADLRRLNVEVKTNQASLAEVRVQLEQQREARGWIDALLAALALSAAALFFWRRWYANRDVRASASPWWRRKKAPAVNWFTSEIGGNAGFAEDSRSIDSEPFWLARSGDTGAVKAQHPSQAASPVSSVLTPVLPRRDQADFALSMPHMPRAVKAEELFDVQQQAEFFISVGQHDQAVAVLRNHISEDVQTSALVYLDLFNLYHQLKRRSDFDLLRLEFNRVFNTKVPSFDLYTGTSLGLEAYETALSRIVSLWPTPKVLEVIEESVFRKPGGQAEAFDLEAYRELLFLYGIAKEIVQAQPEPEPEPEPAVNEILLDFDFLSSLAPMTAGDSTQPEEPRQAFASNTDLQPLSMESGGARLAASADTRFLPVLDIDLDALEEAPLTVIEASART